MGNSSTKHSRMLRAETSEAWRKENQKQILIKLTPKDHKLFDEFSAIEAQNNVERFRILINLLEKSK